MEQVRGKLTDRIKAFNCSLHFDGFLPEGIRIMNPFKENPEALRASGHFYDKFYNDNMPRYLLLGINPGRFGAGNTGVPFTDPKHLISHCDIDYNGKITHEPSSVFIYNMIDTFGGVYKFYKYFYIGAVSPLGFTKLKEGNKEVNYNYYDTPQLTSRVRGFIVDNLYRQIQLGIHTNIVFCMGTGKNFKFLTDLNAEYKFFGRIIPLEHPRYIMQYRHQKIQEYTIKYIEAFNNSII